MYWQHRIKHMGCGIHFVVCSDYENWPKEGATTPTNHITCPECGGVNGFLHWKEQVDGNIFQMVPGDHASVVTIA